MIHRNLHWLSRTGFIITCVLILSAGTGCQATKRGLCCLDNVCRNRCNCADVVTSVQPGPAEYVTQTANAEVLHSVVPPDEETQKKIAELTDQLREAKHERELAVKEASTANERFAKLDAEIRHVQTERDQLLSRTQVLTDHLLTSQQNLMRVERGFADVQTEHERTVMKLENRLTQILDRCNSGAFDE